MGTLADPDGPTFDPQEHNFLRGVIHELGGDATPRREGFRGIAT